MLTAHFTGTSGTPDSTTSYYMGGQYEVKDGTTKKYYSIAGMLVAMNDGSGLQYLLTDHLGSTVAVTNQSGTLTSQQRYLPFGAPRTIPNSPILGTDFTYTGQRKFAPADGMGGIMDYKARFYSPGLMRFLQPDSIIPSILNPQSWNRYSYALNSPIRYSDPTGHLPCEGLWDCIALVAGVIKETAQYIQQNPINISKRLTTNIPVVIPAGYGIKPGIINKAIDLKVGIRVIGRTVGDDLFGPLMGIGAVATILPNQIENVNQGKHLIRDWNEYVGDALVNGAGFITSEISGDIAAAGLLWTGPEGALFRLTVGQSHLKFYALNMGTIAEFGFLETKYGKPYLG